MMKLQSARAAILAAPLKIKTEKLLAFAEKGTVESWQAANWSGGDNGGFLIQYVIHLIVTDYAGAVQDLLWVAAQWLAAACPGAASDAITFEIDMIDLKICDVHLSITVEEQIAAVPDDAGRVSLRPVTDLAAADIGMDMLTHG